jgi:hypothetical protein
MPGRRKLSGLNRFTALLLALVWLGAGFIAIAIGFVRSRWLVSIGGVFAIAYGVLWLRVVVRSRLLSWQEVIEPWRTAETSSRQDTSHSKRP